MNSGDTDYTDGKSFVLTDDIDLADTEFLMIESFSGILDGQGHKILNLTINDITTDSVSDYRIAFIKNNAGTVKNIIFEDAKIISEADSGSDSYSGAAVVVGENKKERSFRDVR